jgi:hypothetical protein
MKVYQILPNRYYGGEINLPNGVKGIPINTTRTPPPPVSIDQYLIWNGNGWLLTKIAPPRESMEELDESEVEESLSESLQNDESNDDSEII